MLGLMGAMLRADQLSLPCSLAPLVGLRIERACWRRRVPERGGSRRSGRIQGISGTGGMTGSGGTSQGGRRRIGGSAGVPESERRWSRGLGGAAGMADSGAGGSSAGTAEGTGGKIRKRGPRGGQGGTRRRDTAPTQRGLRQAR